MLYPLSALSVMYILLMYYISLLLLPPDGFVVCYIGLLVLTLWRFDDDVIRPSPGMGRYRAATCAHARSGPAHSPGQRGHVLWIWLGYSKLCIGQRAADCSSRPQRVWPG